jgi:hypothetical protein
MRYFLRGIVAAALLALLPGAALADTTWDAMQRFGLTGTWALSCKQAAGPSNFWMTYYRDAGGVVRRTLERGSSPDYPTLMVVIDSAHLITSTTMAARFRNDDPNWGDSNGTSVDIIIIKENGRVRTLDSKGSNGKQYVKDGIVVSSGNPIPWIEKCSN